MHTRQNLWLAIEDGLDLVTAHQREQRQNEWKRGSYSSFCEAFIPILTMTE
jgi:hypothetical protein